MNFKQNSLFKRNTELEEEQEVMQGGVLAVWGSPSSGKTTVSVKLADYLARKKKNVLLIFADMTAPPLPCICAAGDLEGEKSLGSILAATHVTENLIKKNCMFYRKNDYLSMVGMLKGENVFTYPPYDQTQAVELIEQAREVAPFVIIDCGRHYHDSRYHCLNLHSVFQKGTIEFRLFNSTTHAGKVKTYIQFCLAISGQALNQTCAATRKTTSTNEKYTFRTWLLRLGMIGDEFKTARKFLLENLEGGIAWKDPVQAEKQKERLKAKKEKEESLRASEEAVQEEPIEEAEECQEQGMNLSL